MAGVSPLPDNSAPWPAPEPIARPSRWRHVLRILAFPIVLLGLAALTLLALDTPIGHRFIADRIAAFAPPSGLRIAIGRIEGSIYGEARLRDVSLADPQGVFLRVPQAELDWRPFNWIARGLDVRRLILRRGTLTRLPKFNPGDPDAPILPAFDIRIDHLRIERLSVAEGVAGPARRVDLEAGVLIRDGKALIRADGRLGGGERLQALLDAEPDRDRFDIKLDYNAPQGGLLAGLTGANRAIRLGIGGKGSWRRWDGALLAEADGKRLAALRLTNRAGTYGALGLGWPEGMLSGMAGRAAGNTVAISASGTFADRLWDGDIRLIGEGLAVQGRGAVDLAGNRVKAMVISRRCARSRAAVSRYPARRGQTDRHARRPVPPAQPAPPAEVDAPHQRHDAGRNAHPDRHRQLGRRAFDLAARCQCSAHRHRRSGARCAAGFGASEGRSDADRQPDRGRQPVAGGPRHRRPAGIARRSGKRRLWPRRADCGARRGADRSRQRRCRGAHHLQIRQGSLVARCPAGRADGAGRQCHADHAGGQRHPLWRPFPARARPAAVVRKRDAERQQAGAGAGGPQSAGRAHDADRARQAGRLRCVHSRGRHCQRRTARGADFRRSAARRRAQGCAGGSIADSGRLPHRDARGFNARAV